MNTTADQGNQSQRNIPVTSDAFPAVPTPQTEEKNQPAPSSSLAWVERNQGIAVGFAFFLIFFYMMPIFIVSVASWSTDFFQESNFLLSWFSAFMKSAQSTLAEFHKVLFPIISALSVIVFRTKPTKSMLFLGLFILLSFIITVYISVVFDIPRIQKALLGLQDPINLELTRAFFTRVQETLLMYLMMLIGISVANAIK
jgi:hypothetical protein